MLFAASRDVQGQQCSAIFDTSGATLNANGHYIAHFTASNTPAPGSCAGYGYESCVPNCPPGFPQAVPGGIDQDVDGSCWPAGTTYVIRWHAWCGYVSNSICYNDALNDQYFYTKVDVPRYPSVKVTYEDEHDRLKIDYRYDHPSDGTLLLYADDFGSPQQLTSDANCFQHPSGTCYYGLSRDCQNTHTYEVTLQGCSADAAVSSGPVVVKPSNCPISYDSTNCTPKQDTTAACPICPPTCLAAPINVGSGDVSVEIPLFSIASTPMPLNFDLSYHSLAPAFPNAISTPIGPGWTHSFNTSLKEADPINYPGRLLLVTPHGQRYYFDRANSNLWVSVKPKGWGATVVVSGGEYVLKEPTGFETHYDTTGKWKSSRDRWQNTISGTYTSGALTSITDSVGRQVTLAYTSGKLSSVQLPDGNTWQLDYSSGELAALRDPIHPTSAWRTFSYANDSHGAYRLLTTVRDAGSALLEGHSYSADDRGISSVSEGGRDSYSVAYGNETDTSSSATVTVDDGTTTRIVTYALVKQNGQYLPGQVNGVCPSCGVTSETQSYAFDGYDNATQRSDAGGHVTRYAYDGFGNVLSITEAAETATPRVTSFEYGLAGRTALPYWPTFITRKREPAATGGTKTTEYQLSTSQMVMSTVEIGQLGSGAPTRIVSTQTFDPRHRLLTADGPRTDLADVTSYAYYLDTDSIANRRGRLQTITDALTHVTTFDDYDAFGTAKSVTDQNGVVTLRVTDARGRVTSTTNKAVAGDSSESTDYVISSVFDARDRLTTTTSARGLTTKYGYEDGTNRLTDIVLLDASGNEQDRRQTTFDLLGEKVSEADYHCDSAAATCANWGTAKRTETYVYDAFGRLGEVHHDGDVIAYKYDLDGLLVGVEDENHTALDTSHDTPNTTYAYDAFHRLTSVTQTHAGAPNGSIATLYTYDAQDNLASVQDPNQNVTSYTYDDFHRLVTQTSPVTGVTSYAYDPAGNLTTTTDANNATTTRVYDAMNRATSAVSKRQNQTDETVTWAYDAQPGYGIGRLTSTTDPAGTTTYSYDRRGLLRSEARTMGGATYTSSYAYDADANRTSITYPSGLTVNYTFDFAQRPITANTGAMNWIWSASYLPFGPIASLVYGNGMTKSMEYDARYRLTGNRLTSPAPNSSLLFDYEYHYDRVGNMTSVKDNTEHGHDRLYSYDDLNRLVAANTGPQLWVAGSYAYDAMGNLLTRTLGMAPPDDGTLSRPKPRRTTALTFSGQVDTMEFQYKGTPATPLIDYVTRNGIQRPVQYDAAGNEIHASAATPAEAYSPRNLLASVTDDSSEDPVPHRIDYGYDGRGIRVVRSESPTPSGTASRYYFYSPELHILESTVDDAPNIWGSRRTSTMTAGLPPSHEYIWFNGQPVGEIGPPRTADIDILTKRRPTSLDATDYFYTVTDHIGTPILQTPTDLSGQIVWRAEYEPYGNVWQMRAGAPADQPLRLPGQELAMTQEGGEENYNVFRWYRSSWGRYTQADPVGLAAGLNEYAYGDDQPTLLIDPLGLATNKPPKPGKTQAAKPPTDCPTICAMAYADPKKNKNGGGVVCLNGVKCPCVFDTSYSKKGDCAELDQIILQHEKQHVPEAQCPSKDLCLGTPNAPLNIAAIECKHRKESIGLLQSALASGYQTQTCQKEMLASLLSLNSWVQQHCN